MVCSTQCRLIVLPLFNLLFFFFFYYILIFYFQVSLIVTSCSAMSDTTFSTCQIMCINGHTYAFHYFPTTFQYTKSNCVITASTFNNLTISFCTFFILKISSCELGSYHKQVASINHRGPKSLPLPTQTFSHRPELIVYLLFDEHLKWAVTLCIHQNNGDKQLLVLSSAQPSLAHWCHLTDDN